MATEWKQIIEPVSIYDEWGLRERRLDRGFCHLRIGFSSNPGRNDEWAKWKATTYGGFDAPLWRREFGIDYHARSGQRVWPMLSSDHNAQVDMTDWTKYRIIDQGIRHPTVCLWVAINSKGDRHVYKEYYATDRSIAMNCRAIEALSEGEEIIATFIDPSTAKRGAETLKTQMDVYEENGIYCTRADNSFAGYDAVGSAVLSTLARVAIRTGQMPSKFDGLKPTQNQLLTLAAKPALTFDFRFTNRCFRECCNLRWQETKGDTTQSRPREKPVDVEDDGPDCVRYAVQSPLWWRKTANRKIEVININDFFKMKRRDQDGERIRKRQTSRGYH